MSVNVFTSANYVVIEDFDFDVDSIVDEVNTYLATGLWACAGGLVVRSNGAILQALYKI